MSFFDRLQRVGPPGARFVLWASSLDSRRQFITNRTARTQDNKNVGRKPVTHWHRREREKKRERERKLTGRKRREGGHGSAEARKAEGQAEM